MDAFSNGKYNETADHLKIFPLYFSLCSCNSNNAVRDKSFKFIKLMMPFLQQIGTTKEMGFIEKDYHCINLK